MPIEWIGFTLFVAIMVGTPGPANMVVMAAGARFGAARATPFLIGVILGKQLIIWPLGLGLIGVLGPDTLAFQLLRWASVAYILWLAWKIAGMRIEKADAGNAPPDFFQGLAVHPVNPKAWAAILGVLTNFVNPESSPIAATAAMAFGFLVIQAVFQPLWMLGGSQIARVIGAGQGQVWLMRVLAAAMVVSVLLALMEES